MSRAGCRNSRTADSVDVANVVWCTGFHPGFSWIDLPVLGPQEPLHRRGVVESEPGLYFIGLKFLYSVSSEQIHGVGPRRGLHRREDRRPARSSAGRIDRQTIHRRSEKHNRFRSASHQATTRPIPYFTLKESRTTSRMS